ncbi:hypothetical protein J4E91_004051 [Alternaria rosae]|nr:hypothetical protein J4E91_004051 [Alternaria rosae]
MGVFSFLDKPVFSSRFKFPIHIAQVVLVILAIALTLPRLFIANVPRTRASTYTLGMGAKSLILLAYLILSEHSPRFQRWHSYKAHAIISCIEVIFWSVVAGMMFSTNLSYCKGPTCGLGWVVVIIAIVIVNSEIIVAGICIKEFREWKSAGKPKSAKQQHTRRPASDEEEVVQTRAERPKEAPVQATEQAYFQSERRHSQRSHSMHHGESLWEAQHTPRFPRKEHQHRSHRSGDRTRELEERSMHEMEEPRYAEHQQYTSRESRH